MQANKARDSARVYQLKIALKVVRPSVWRRIQVRSDVTLAKLHRILQETMGWLDGHLHQFRVGQTCYGVPDPGEFHTVHNERSFRLDQILPAQKARLTYDYDFGDGWEHTVVVEKIMPPEPGATYPRCVAGKRACPPEDCGGSSGYERLIAIMKDPSHEEHADMKAWLGQDLDPEAFDLAEVNRALSRLR